MIRGGIETPPPKYSDNFVRFGNKTAINTKKLAQNLVYLKYQKSLGPICSFRGMRKITNEMKALLIDLLDTGEINVDLQKKLDPEMATLFEKMLSVAKLTSTLKYKKAVMSVEDFIARFEILRGGFVAGNHSEELRKELTELIKLLSSPMVGRISADDAAEFIDFLK